MKQVLIALLVIVLAYTNGDAQTACKPVAPKHTTAATHKSGVKKTSTTMACRMLPFQVCTILPDRKSVSCYYTSDTDLTPLGAAKIYGPNDPMPGQPVHFKVRTVVIKDKDKGAYCVRNKENNATICTQPGMLLRDENGYYSYGEAQPKTTGKRITAK